MTAEILETLANLSVWQSEVDEVEVFGMFGGGLPVLHRTVTASAKGMGDRSHKPCGQMDYHIHWTFMNVRKHANAEEIRGRRSNLGIREKVVENCRIVCF
ncbi:MAG: hypothetical protein KZY74_08510 [Paenibacillaceae bacterium]|nr:hypothetical protein [Paenibacillaceae bacterium]